MLSFFVILPQAAARGPKLEPSWLQCVTTIATARLIHARITSAFLLHQSLARHPTLAFSGLATTSPALARM